MRTWIAIALAAVSIAVSALAADKHDFDVRVISRSLTEEKDGKIVLDNKTKTIEVRSDFGNWKAPFGDIISAELERRGERTYLHLRQRMREGEADHFFVLKNRDDITRDITQFEQMTGLSVKSSK